MSSRFFTVLRTIRTASLMAFGRGRLRVRSGLVIGALLGALCLAGIGGLNAAAQEKPAPTCLDDDVKKEIARLEKQAVDMRTDLDKLLNQLHTADEQLKDAQAAKPPSPDKVRAAKQADDNIREKYLKLVEQFYALLTKIAKLKLLPPCPPQPAPGPGGAAPPGPGGGSAPGKPAAERCRTPADDAEIARLEQKLGELEKELGEEEDALKGEEGQLRNMQKQKAAGPLLQDQVKNVAAAKNKVEITTAEIREAKKLIAALKALKPCPPPAAPPPGGPGQPGGPEKGAAPGGAGGAGGGGVKPPEPPRAPELPGAEKATGPSGGPFAVNFGFGLLGLVPRQSFDVHGSISGDLHKTNNDLTAMPALNFGGIYRTNSGVSLAAGAKVAFPTGDTFTATGMTTGGFDATIKSRINAPIVAPYLGVGGRIANAGTLFGSVGAWGEQDRVTVDLSVPSFSERFSRNQYEWRPFGAVGFIAPWEVANLPRMEVVSELMWVGSGSRHTLAGGNAFSFAQFKARDSFAFRIGLQWKFDLFERDPFGK